MIVVASAVQAAPTRSRKPEGWLTGYMGKDYSKPASERPRGEPGQLFPMAYLVERDPSTSLQAHFHVADQFQVFVSGGGALGTHPIEALSIHFVSAHSPYGPIEAGAEGIGYLTLRASYDPGARYMPEARGELPPRPRLFREVVAGPTARTAPDDLGRMQGTLSTSLMAEADGLGAWLHRLAPGQSVTGPAPAEGAGQHWVVLGGKLDRGDADALGPYSCVFLSSEEPRYAAKAGREGLEILAVQYPRPARRT